MKVLIDFSVLIIIYFWKLWSNTTEEKLKEKQEIKTDFGQTLYWDYYEYVKDNPITNGIKTLMFYMEIKIIFKTKI